MKNVFKERKIHIACVCLLLVMLLAGCSNSDTNNQETDLFDVLNRADSACSLKCDLLGHILASEAISARGEKRKF